MNDARPESVEEALARARAHGRSAAAESVAALSALLDAGALATGGLGDEGALATLRETLDRVRRWLDPEGGRDADSVLEGVRAALDEEVERWEEKSREDPDARAILRAFLAVREVIWEFSERSRPKPDAPESARPPRSQPRRVPVEG